jgi:hypothetical protein
VARRLQRRVLVNGPQRIQRKRVKGWRMPGDAVYVGRPTVYGNPFRVGVPFCGPTIRTVQSPAEAVDSFRAWVALDTLDPLCWDRDLIVAHVHLAAALERSDLRGRDLACWCPLDQPCHADVLIELANR